MKSPRMFPGVSHRVLPEAPISNPISKEDEAAAWSCYTDDHSTKSRIERVAQAIADRGATAKAEGRREAFEEALQIVENWRALYKRQAAAGGDNKDALICQWACEYVAADIVAARDKETP